MKEGIIQIHTKTLWTILGIVTGVFIAWNLRNVIMIVLISVIIASFVEAGVKLFKKIKFPRMLSVFLVYGLGITIIIGIFYLIVPLFLNELADFIDLFPKSSLFAKVVGPIADHGLTSSTLKTLLDKNVLSGGNDLVQTLGGIFGSMLNALLVLIISFYLSAQEKGIEQFLRVVTPEKYETYIVDLWQRIERKIGYWFGGQVLVAIFVSLVTYIGLFVMGVPYALILSAIAGLSVFIPFGTSLALAPAVVLGYLGDGIGLAIQIFFFYGVVHYIESYFVSPYILHRTIGIPMLVMILSVVACFELFGFAGIIIAIPLAVLILELIYDHGKLKKPHA